MYATPLPFQRAPLIAERVRTPAQVGGWWTAFTKGDWGRGFSEMGEEAIALMSTDELGLLLNMVAPGAGNVTNMLGKGISKAQGAGSKAPAGVDPNMAMMMAMLAQNQANQPKPTPAWVWPAVAGGGILLLVILLLLFLVQP